MSNPMGLTVPTTTETPGPDYADELNADLEKINQHDHSDGKGNPVHPAGLDIDDDLSFGSNNAMELRTVRFDNQSAVLALPADVRELYVVDGDLYFNNADGVPVQVTAGNALNAAAIGGFTGLAGTTGAATYDPNNATFTFTSDTNVPATLVSGPILLRATDLKTTLLKRATGGADHTVTLPASLPASTKFIRETSAGVFENDVAPDGSSLEVSGSSLRVKALGVTKAMQAAVGQQVSSSSSNFTGSSTSFAGVTNLAVTITTSGRPVIIACIADDANAHGASGWTVAGGAGVIWAALQIAQTGSASATIGLCRIGGNAVETDFAPASLWHLRALAAGTYTFTVQYKVDAGTTQLAATDMKLVAYEL